MNNVQQLPLKAPLITLCPSLLMRAGVLLGTELDLMINPNNAFKALAYFSLVEDIQAHTHTHTHK